MADDHILATDRAQHGAGYLSGIGSFIFPEQVLGADRDVGGADKVAEVFDQGEGGADHDRFVMDVGHQRDELFGEVGSLGQGLIHFPVAGDDRFSHNLFIIDKLPLFVKCGIFCFINQKLDVII